MRSFFAFLGDIWPSIVATILVAVASFVSLGMVGLVQYYLASPALNLAFPPLEAWDQSVVWPMLIGAPLLWSPAFFVAGIVNRRLSRSGWQRARRIAVYVGIVWLAAVASWSLLLSVNRDVWL